uniref:Uncharacterized protein n=1 Tax=Bionectria ochroleuca TaxID=29856 RepID=A0A8H7NKM4_BIOOC
MELGRLGPMVAFPGYPYDLPIASWEMPRWKGTLFRDRQRGEGSVLTALPRDLAAMYMHGLVMGLACLFLRRRTSRRQAKSRRRHTMHPSLGVDIQPKVLLSPGTFGGVYLEQD